MKILKNIAMSVITAIIFSIALEMPRYILILLGKLKIPTINNSNPFVSYLIMFVMLLLFMGYELLLCVFTLRIARLLYSKNTKQTIINVFVCIISIFILGLKYFHVFNFWIQYIMSFVGINININFWADNWLNNDAGYLFIYYSAIQTPIFLFFLIGGVINIQVNEHKKSEKTT